MSLVRSLVIIFLAVSFLISPLTARAADGTPPISTTTLTGNLGNNGWYTSTVAVDIASEDLESGVSAISYTLDGSTTTQNFTSGTNLLPNPSFEAGSVDGWVVGGSALFAQDNTSAKFDANSIKITSSDTGFKDWQTQNGVLLTGGHTYTLSVWVKYSSVIGGGVKILLDSSASPSVTGTQSSWVRLQLTYSPLVSGSYYPKLGIDGPGVVNFDGAVLAEQPLAPEVGFVVAGSGSHLLSYFATNNDGVSEAARSISFKIDAQGPGNWRNLTQNQIGNDHTFYFTDDVDDSLSGIATGTGQFQYSLDGGATWGRFTDVGKCNSGWIADGWTQTAQSPSSPGVTTTTMTTPTTDFCDSNFAGCDKKVRFQIQDQAGNSSERIQCLNSAWFQELGGDVHSVGNIAPSAQSTSDWLVASNGGISNMTSNKNWLLPNYQVGWTAQSIYNDWKNLFTSKASALPGGKLPVAGNGYYLVGSSFTIDSGTLPVGLASADVNAVVIVLGNLNVNIDFTMKPTSAYVFIVTGDLLVNGAVKNIAGYYLPLGKFDDHSGGSAGNQLTVSGAAWPVGGFALDRDLGKAANTTTPADVFALPAGIYADFGLSSLISGTQKLSWIELAP